ncbi:MAG: hypothetical protein R3C49_21300 [Planctomycetaceae bacterium]
MAGEIQMRAGRRVVVVWLLLSSVGCLMAPFRPAGLRGPNAVQVPVERADLMWERSVAVLNDLHFVIARESRLEGLIETEYRGGSGCLEPWHHDSIGHANRIESTLQSIRRKVYVQFQNASPGMVSISVRVDKEIEDLQGLAATYAGGATFPESDPLNRDLDQAVGQSGPSRWLHKGTDPALESEIMARIQHAVIR